MNAQNSNKPKRFRSPPYLLDAVRTPIQKFIHTEEIGAMVLLAAAVAALVWVNSPWSDSYFEFWKAEIDFDIQIFAIHHDLKAFVKEGLMAIFFFVVGLEIKRELLHGELSTVRKAVLPAVAAIGGMVIPAAVYLIFNASGESLNGWGIPMATDIAFAIGVLALVGKRLPAELRIFLLAVAVVDDLGAIALIAIVYTESISFVDLGLAFAVYAAIAGFIWLGIRSIGLYMILAIVMWHFFVDSGIHATLAGVLLAALVPSKPDSPVEDFDRKVSEMNHDFKLAKTSGDETKANTIVEQVENLSRASQSPMESLNAKIHPWVSFVILPLFALATAGVVVSSNALTEALSSPVTLGVALGLLIGKPIGIFGVSWLVVRLGLSQLPSTITWTHIIGVGFLAGIGFTVSIFIAGIAFDSPEVVDQAKMGIFGASLLAGVVGYLMLRFLGGPNVSNAPNAS